MDDSLLDVFEYMECVPQLLTAECQQEIRPDPDPGQRLHRWYHVCDAQWVTLYQAASLLGWVLPFGDAPPNETEQALLRRACYSGELVSKKGDDGRWRVLGVSLKQWARGRYGYG